MRIFWLLGLLTPLLAGCGSPTAPPAEDLSGGLLLASDRSGIYQIYRLRGDEPVPLTRDTAYDSWWPRASPDGRTIVF